MSTPDRIPEHGYFKPSAKYETGMAGELLAMAHKDPTPKKGAWATLCRLLLAVSPYVTKFLRGVGLPFKVTYLNSRLALFKLENLYLRLEMRAVAKGLVARERIEPGDVVVFILEGKTDEYGRVTSAYGGHSFGIGWAALKNLQREMSVVAGGPVQTMASPNNSIRVSVLNRPARQGLRATLDAAERGEKGLEFPLPEGGKSGAEMYTDERGVRRWQLPKKS